MKYPVLILNTDYKPFDIWPWQKAMSRLLTDDGVEPVYGVDGNILRHKFIVRDGRGNEYDVPAVLILKRYEREHNRKASYSKANIYARDLGICQYCGTFVKPHLRTVDHVIPRAHWNPKRYTFSLNSFENVVTCCKPCNQQKRNRTPNQAGMKLINQPKQITRGEVYYNKLAMQSEIPPQWRNFIYV